MAVGAEAAAVEMARQWGRWWGCAAAWPKAVGAVGISGEGRGWAEVAQGAARAGRDSVGEAGSGGGRGRAGSENRRWRVAGGGGRHWQTAEWVASDGNAWERAGVAGEGSAESRQEGDGEGDRRRKRAAAVGGRHPLNALQPV